MSKNIYEILNDADMESEFTEDQLLSDYEKNKLIRDVKKEINSMKNKKRMIRPSIAVACACAVIGLSSVGVIGAEFMKSSELFKNIFKLEDTKEKDIIDEIGTPVNISKSDNGYKITAENLVGDDNNLAVIFSIQNEDGSDLYKNEFDPDECGIHDFEESIVKDANYVEFLPAKSQDKVEFALFLTAYDAADLDKKNDFKIVFTGMTLHVDGSDKDIEGSWRLDIPLNYKNTGEEFAKDKDVTINGIDAELEKLIISSLGFSFRINSEKEYMFDNLPMSLKLKDGSSVKLDSNVVLEKKSDDGRNAYEIHGLLEDIIFVGDIESLEIGDCAISK